MTSPRDASDSPLDPSEPVSRLLAHVLATHAQTLMASWSAAHLNERDGVHTMRVSARRLRSALASGRRFVDPQVTEPLREELGWLVGVLGEARDSEVQIARIDSALDGLVSERTDLDWGSEHVRPALLAPLLEKHQRSMVGVRGGLESSRYAGMQAALATLLEDPPWSASAGSPILRGYVRLVGRELRRLDRRMTTATQAHLDPDLRSGALHEARKAVKRSRYVATPLVPLYGKRASKLVHRLKTLQSTLGDLQDTVITRHYLVDLVRTEHSGVDPSVALVAGVLIEREATHASAYDEAAVRAWACVRQTKRLR